MKIVCPVSSFVLVLRAQTRNYGTSPKLVGPTEAGQPLKTHLPQPQVFKPGAPLPLYLMARTAHLPPWAETLLEVNP